MKNGHKIILAISISVILIGGLIMAKNFLTNDSTKITKEQQIAYLKEHEQEMTDAIKKNHQKIENIQWDWDSVEVGTIGNGTPQGGGTTLTIDGGFNHIEDSSFTLGFELESSNKYPNMNDMIMMQPLRVVRNGVNDLYE
jgi:hypothetical protein